MHHKNIILILAALAVSACLGQDGGFGPAYDPASLNRITVQAEYPDGIAVRAGAKLTIADVTGGVSYKLDTDVQGRASTHLPNGVYRISLRDNEGEDILNATQDRVIISGQDLDLTLRLKRSKPGLVVIKEIYNGGCLKLPKEGNYQSDKYILIHNNSIDTYYLDGLCMGSVYPYNSEAVNPWGAPPEYVPIVQAVLMMPGTGQDFPLEPGEDALVCLCGAIDHTREYPLSVNLNRADAFVCYDPVLFPNQGYHPTPGDQVDHRRYLVIVIKTGQANAYTLSVTSPAFVLFRPAEGTSIEEWVKDTQNLPQIPGSSETVVAIPPEWVIDGVDVFNGAKSNNLKRLPDTIDAGFTTLSENYKGHTLMRKVDPDADLGFEFLLDTNNSTEDFYERETQSLHEEQ